jgi:hypothetical protein
MSLINDALKRASQSEKNRPRDTGAHAAMQPAPESRRSLVPALAGVCIFILLVMAGWLVWRSFPHRANPQPFVASVKELPPVVVMPPLPKVDPAPVPAPPPVPAPAQVERVPLPAPAPLPFPELKLQGIYYNRTNPKAAINGQIRAQNEQIGDVRILTITQNKVTVEWNGQTRDLNLGGE